MTRFTVLDSPLGPLTVVGGDDGLTGLYLSEQRHLPDADSFGCRDDTLLPAVREQLEAYWAGQITEFDVPLATAGTAFQVAVWQALRAIPYGSVCTYGDLAERIGRPTAVRAVGAANGRNPICIVIPCHRVIGADGSMTGYAGGLDRKMFLLQHEGALPETLL